MKKKSTARSTARKSPDMQVEYDFDYRRAKPDRFADRMSAVGKPNQRLGAISNSHVGADFERVALKVFARRGIILTRNFAVDLGLSRKKRHCFDLGASNPKVIVECKSHRWTAGANVPSAKMTVWNVIQWHEFLTMNYTPQMKDVK